MVNEPSLKWSNYRNSQLPEHEFSKVYNKKIIVIYSGNEASQVAG